MCTNLMGLTLSLILIINVQIYAYKNAAQIRTPKIPQDDFSRNESDRNEISNKKYNHTDKNETLDNFEKIKEQFYNVTTNVDVEVTEDPNPFGGEEIPPEDEEEEENYDDSFTSECILARSEFYLSWWVNENGSLRVPTISRLNGSGIMDLSLNFTSEDSIYTKVFSFTTSNPSEVCPSIFYLARNKCNFSLSQIFL